MRLLGEQGHGRVVFSWFCEKLGNRALESWR